MMNPDAVEVSEIDGSTSGPSIPDRRDSKDPCGPSKQKNAVWIRLFVLLFLLLVSFIIYQTGFFKVFLSEKRILTFLDSLGPLGFAGFIVLQAAQVVFAPIPGEVTGLIGGYIYGPVPGVMLSTTGLVLGSYLAFSLSRAFGRPFVEKFVRRSTMERFDYLLHHKGLFLIFMLFLLPGFPKDYLCLILGLGHLSTMEFLVISSVGRLMGTILLTLGGGYIRYHEYEKLLVLIGVALVIFLMALLFRNKLEALLQTLHLKSDAKSCNSVGEKTENP